MADRVPRILWPGVAQPIDCQYVLSHGISPGVARLSLLPQDADQIALQGDLVLGDGAGEVRLRNCKVSALRTTLDTTSGQTWTLEIFDRRWRWTSTGFVHGTYNVSDDTRDTTRPPETGGPYVTLPRHYVPWTVRLPHDLIRQCLDAMGERGYRIDAPNAAYPLPAIQWDFENPAQALSRLCETLGCRVVYRPDSDTVWVVPMGVGADLPDPGPGTICRDSPGLATPSRPDAILVVGAPTKFEVEWVLEAVGEEWDGRLKPIDALSYAPATPRVVQRQKIEFKPAAIVAGDVLQVKITFQGRERTASYTATVADLAAARTGLAAAINAQVGLFGLTATVADDGFGSDAVYVTGTADGLGFDYLSRVIGVGWIEERVVDLAQSDGLNGRSRWYNETPPAGFTLGVTQDTWRDNAQAQRFTNRMTYTEAVARANRTVFRYYRIANVNIQTGSPGQFIPGYGTLDPVGGIYRVVLLNEQLNQAVPPTTDEQVFGKDQFPITRDYYDGLWKQRPARCFGRYYQQEVGLYRKLGAQETNSRAQNEVLVDFSLVPERQLVIFSEPVFLWDSTYGTRPADIRLRCACHLRDARTNALVRYTRLYPLPGPKLGTQPAVIRHDDIESLVRGTYLPVGDFADSPDLGRVGISLLFVDDNRAAAAARADYYATAAALRYQTPRSGERQYNGIIPVFCDGAIQQVTWRISEGQGAETTASVNSEHFIYAPQYPERLRLEYLRSQVEKSPRVARTRSMLAEGGA